MAIRQRLYRKVRKLAYHREYGSLSSPPIRHGFWPNGAFVTSQNVPRHRNKTIVLGWMVKRSEFRNFQSFGVWIAAHVGWIEQRIPVKYKYLDPAKDFIYVGEALNHLQAMDMLTEAWTDRHNITLL